MVYKNREDDYLLAIKLRKEGYGYTTIANKLEGDVPVSTVRNWVSYIGTDKEEAYEKSDHFKPKKSFNQLAGKNTIRKRFIELHGYFCDSCELTEWNDRDITLELHHIDGNKKNNVEENIELLCPNCHSQTDNFRNNMRE